MMEKRPLDYWQNNHQPTTFNYRNLVDLSFIIHFSLSIYLCNIVIFSLFANNIIVPLAFISNKNRRTINVVEVMK